MQAGKRLIHEAGLMTLPCSLPAFNTFAINFTGGVNRQGGV